MQASAGGQHNEIGAEYRARLGALLATAVLVGDDLGQLGAPVGGIALSIRAEADTPVDDLVLRLQSGGLICVQAKHQVSLSKVPSVRPPWCAAGVCGGEPVAALEEAPLSGAG